MLLAICFAAILSNHTSAQNTLKKYLYHEELQDPYIPNEWNNKRTSPAYKTRDDFFFMTQVNVNEDGENIIGDAANEPSIAVDPTNPNRMIIGWRQFDNISSNFRQAGIGYTEDGGETWTFPEVIEGGVFRSDPVLDADSDGNIYYNSLTSNFGDYTCDDCVMIDGDPNWGTMAVGPDGELYIVGEGLGSEIIVAKSASAMNPELPANFESYSEVNLDGQLGLYPNVNPAGLMGQADIDVDVSGGPGHGNVYVVASVNRSSNTDPGDVMFARSTDGGQTWDDPIRINDDEFVFDHQWFGTLSVAPGGRIDVVWLDTRNSPGNSVESQLFYAYSLDQGDNWSANFELSDMFDPHVGWPNQDKMGDYFDMRSDDESAHLAWAATFNGEQDVYYGRISPLVTSVAEFGTENNPLSLSCYPNPASDKTTIRYTAPENSEVTLTLCDIYGKEVKNIQKTIATQSQNHVELDTRDLSNGFYMCALRAGKWNKSVKVMVVG